MRLADAHCHISSMAYEAQEQVVQTARDCGLIRIVDCGYDLKSCQRSLRLADICNHFIRPVLGVAPQTVTEHGRWAAELKLVKKSADKIAGVGEIGLDFVWAQTPEQRALQVAAFKDFLKLSLKLEKPVVVHSRGAEQEVLDLLHEHCIKHALLHFFSGTPKQARYIADRGWYISVPPTPSSARKLVVKAAPLDCLMLESDSPTVGQSPVDVTKALSIITELKHIPAGRAAETTTENCLRLFG